MKVIKKKANKTNKTKSHLSSRRGPDYSTALLQTIWTIIIISLRLER
jgi:hypothetical protein